MGELVTPKSEQSLSDSADCDEARGPQRPGEQRPGPVVTSGDRAFRAARLLSPNTLEGFGEIYAPSTLIIHDTNVIPRQLQPSSQA